MRRALLVPLLAGALSAQSQSERITYTYGLDGRKVESSRVESNAVTAETVRNLNGQTVPTERTREQILTNTSELKITERIIQLFDSNGRPTGQTKVRIEQRPLPNGGVSTVETISDADINGSYTIRERTTSHANKSPGLASTEVLSERPSINGDLSLVEKRLTTRHGDDNRYREETAIYRAGDRGAFVETERELRSYVTQGSRSTTEVERFNTNATGKMSLVARELRQADKQADGAESETVDIYGLNVAEYSAKPALRERQSISRRATASGSIETLSVRAADLVTGKLGPVQPISETVCRGACRP